MIIADSHLYFRECIENKKRELQQAKMFFENCDPEHFDLANARLTLVQEELSKLYRDAREVIANA